jgi:hypothetical protein
MSTNLANVLRNPKSPEFQRIYVSLGKVEGKKQYAIDCRKLKIQISMQGMQTIENGFSRKERLAYSNNCDVNSSIQNWGNDSKRAYSCNKQTIQKQKEELKDKKQKILDEKKQKQKEEEEEENFNKWRMEKVVVEDAWDD